MIAGSLSTYLELIMMVHFVLTTLIFEHRGVRDSFDHDFGRVTHALVGVVFERRKVRRDDDFGLRDLVRVSVVSLVLVFVFSLFLLCFLLASDYGASDSEIYIGLLLSFFHLHTNSMSEFWRYFSGSQRWQ